MIKIVSKYAKYMEELPQLLKDSPYKTSFIIEELQIPSATYYRKLKDKSFTVEEVEKLTKILFPNEAFLAKMGEPLSNFRKKIKQRKVTELEKILKGITNAVS